MHSDIWMLKSPQMKATKKKKAKDWVYFDSWLWPWSRTIDMYILIVCSTNNCVCIRDLRTEGIKTGT